MSVLLDKSSLITCAPKRFYPFMLTRSVINNPAKKSQVILRNVFCRQVKSQRRTRGTFMRVLSNKSFSHYRCVEAALPFSAVAQRLRIGG